VQELEYTQTTIQTSKASAWSVDDVSLTKNTPLKRIKTWIVGPEHSSIHFLVERNLIGGEIREQEYTEKRTICLRVVLQAHIASEVGELRYPMPVLDNYDSFVNERHGLMPDKKKNVLNPFKNEHVPYWIVEEVSV
jgi:hypothetical protein